MDGHPWVGIAPTSNPSGNASNTIPLADLLRKPWDGIVLWTGYKSRAFWRALFAGKRRGIPVLFGTDAHELRSRSGDPLGLKRAAKRAVWPALFRLADGVLCQSTGTVELMERLGIPANRRILVKDTVDNDAWLAGYSAANPSELRERWAIPADAPVILYCAKLQPWKAPEDLLRAFAELEIPDARLVMVGTGPCETDLKTLAEALGIAERVHWMGFLTQAELPSAYAASDLLVLPSHFEPFGIVVPEAMLCGTPALVSDKVGARFDLIREGRTGWLYPAGDVAALRAKLKQILDDPEMRRRVGANAKALIQTHWTPRQSAEAIAEGVTAARFRPDRTAG